MTQGFGKKIRELRKAKNFGQRALASLVDVSHTYVSKIENEKLDFGDYPSEELICKIAEKLAADTDELLMLAQKIPQQIKNRVLERPDVFRKIAELDDKTLNELLKKLDKESVSRVSSS
jgi:HTH-type transcriptional regulator, competence development regulator